MKTKLFAVLIALLTSGCGSVAFNSQFPPAPEAVAVAGAPEIGLAAVRDIRTSTEVGTIGMASVVAGPELVDYLDHSLSASLVQKGFKVQNAPEPGKGSTSGFTAKIVQVTLQSASLNTFDAVMAPAQITLAIAIQVYDPSGKVSYAQAYQSDIKAYIGMHGQAGYETRTGEVLSQAVNQAVSNAMSDQQLLAALKVGPQPLPGP
jgi:hypothetical protein